MKIIDCKKAENCLEGEFIYKYYFDTEWNKELIKSMEGFGLLRYYESFPKPMFQIGCPDGTIIKGLESEKECRIIFPRRDPAPAKENFEAQFLKMACK
jgi:hypothetical protein